MAFLSQRYLYVMVGAFFCLASIMVGVTYSLQAAPSVGTTSSEQTQSGELASQVEGVTFAPSKSFLELVDYFQKLARDEGGEYAFAVMINSELPPNTDTHLLGHVIGDVLYEQEGLEGMSKCTHDFRNACSHSIVIGALLEHGVGVFEDINEVCREAPGESGLSYNMCFHGFGHGVLAYTDYDLEAAVELCERTGTAEHQYYEFNECVGGAIMEIHAGIHDRATWEANALQFLDETDPAYLCEHEFIPQRVRDICYVYLTPFIFDVYAAGEFPTDEHIARSFEYCGQVESSSSRTHCYGGIGKELPGLSQGRDVSRIQQLERHELQAIHNRCALAFDREGYEACNKYVLTSLYWGGESHPTFPATYCELVADPESNHTCYRDLHESMSYYLEPQVRDSYRAYCNEYTGRVREDCLHILNL